MNVLCIQISNKLINKDQSGIDSEYYEKLYKKRKKQGYYKGVDFWELPQWITEIDFNLNPYYNVDFYICNDINQTIEYIMKNDYEIVCFSVLDVNKDIIKDIIKTFNFKIDRYHDLKSTHFIIGGYINLQKLIDDNELMYTIPFKSIAEFTEFLNIPYKKGYDYRLFKDYKIIPRLTLSTGCLNNCDFCTVEKCLKEIDTKVILDQCRSFKDLKFKLVYINDKTFFQAKNHNLLKQCYNIIKSYNKEFEGFIIQTTTTQLLKIDNDTIKDYHIKFIELGIESFNDKILKQYHKPSTEKTTLKAINKIARLDQVYLIPNIIIGIPEETFNTYAKTHNFIERNKNIISHLNIYNLAVYENTPLSKKLKHDNSDKNENNINKSFHTDKNPHISFFQHIFDLGLSILNQELK